MQGAAAAAVGQSHHTGWADDLRAASAVQSKVLCVAKQYSHLLKKDERFTLPGFLSKVEISTCDPSVILVLHRLSRAVTQLASIYDARTTNTEEELLKL